MSEVTDRNVTRAAIAAGGWNLVWGDPINEWDAVLLIMSIPTGSVALWVEQQTNAQLQKFNQSLSDVKPDIVKQASAFLKALLDGSDQANKASMGWE
ncbi:hypothetical protein LTR36_008893 [Oleoguttula mirabilis]|uniref:Uncharacterized protein n=1 Tax=Oleoguttula mirabilis TaxID=1507867 RepID=A0AAV9J7N4_9PEZI|nr:hypothetical protein LTR36_008893 [Oleoguttula mirabilis]